jgi:hypothetical protein
VVSGAYLRLGEGAAIDVFEAYRNGLVLVFVFLVLVVVVFVVVNVVVCSLAAVCRSGACDVWRDVQTNSLLFGDFYLLTVAAAAA